MEGAITVTWQHNGDGYTALNGSWIVSWNNELLIAVLVAQALVQIDYADSDSDWLFVDPDNDSITVPFVVNDVVQPDIGDSLAVDFDANRYHESDPNAGDSTGAGQLSYSVQLDAYDLTP